MEFLWSNPSNQWLKIPQKNLKLQYSNIRNIEWKFNVGVKIDRWFSNYVRITNLWGFLKLSFRRYSYLGQNNCLCLRSRVVAWSCFDEQIRRKSWFTLWWFVVVVISSLAFMFCPHFEDWWSYLDFYGLNAKITSLFIISAVPVLTI